MINPALVPIDAQMCRDPMACAVKDDEGTQSGADQVLEKHPAQNLPEDEMVAESHYVENPPEGARVAENHHGEKLFQPVQVVENHRAGSPTGPGHRETTFQHQELVQWMVSLRTCPAEPGWMGRRNTLHRG